MTIHRLRDDAPLGTFVVELPLLLDGDISWDGI